MSAALQMPVVPFSAKHGHCFQDAQQAIAHALQHSTPVPPENISALLAADSQIDADMEFILQHSVEMPLRFSDRLTTRLDRIFLHPWLGLPLFFLILFLLFQTLFLLGKPLQDFVAQGFEFFRQSALEPLLSGLPGSLRGFLIEGIYNGMATIATFVPLIILFFLFMALVEDSGYLSRAAFLMDALMARLGLDGRGFVMLLMGFGCNVPALMGTRVMRSRAMRLLTMLIIPFSLCSARLQVFIFITAAIFSARTAPIALFSLYLLSFGAAFATALLFKGYFRSNEPFVLELPPYRLPTLRQMVLRGTQEVGHFLRRASKFIIMGVVLVWVLTHFPEGAAPGSDATWAGGIGRFMEPLLAPIGIDRQLTIALIFGFVAKEIVIGSLAVIYSAEGAALSGALAAQMDWVRAYSFMLFTLIYTPCLSAIATLRSESKNLGFAFFAVLFSLVFAWLISFLFYQAARMLGL